MIPKHWSTQLTIKLYGPLDQNNMWLGHTCAKSIINFESIIKSQIEKIQSFTLIIYDN